WAKAACGHARTASAPMERTRFILLGILDRARRRFGQSGQSAARGGHENFAAMEFDHRQAHRRREHRRFDDPHGAAAALRQPELALEALGQLQAAPDHQPDQRQKQEELEGVPEHQAWTSASTPSFAGSAARAAGWASMPTISIMRSPKRLPSATTSPRAMSLPLTFTSSGSSVRRSSMTTLSSPSASTSRSGMSTRPSSTVRRTSMSWIRPKPGVEAVTGFPFAKALSW